MGQKVHPNGIRLGIVKPWNSTWFANTKEFADNLDSDFKVRQFLTKELAKASVSRIVIERPAKSIRVTIHTARPGIVIGKKVSQALDILTYTNKKAAVLVKKVLESAIANAEHNDGADIDDLKITKIFVDEGPTMKRIMPRAKGRADRILKRTSHITVVVSDR